MYQAEMCVTCLKKNQITDNYRKRLYLQSTKLEEYTDKRDADFVREADFENRQAPQRQDAEKFIVEYLRNGKRLTSELDAAACAAGISRSSLARAKTKLKQEKKLAGKSEGFGQNKAFYSYLLEQRT